MKFQFTLSDQNQNYIFKSGQHQWSFDCAIHEQRVTVNGFYGDELTPKICLNLLDQLISQSGARELVINQNLIRDLPLNPTYWQQQEQGILINRCAFYQIREIWLHESLLAVTPHVLTSDSCELGPVPLRPVFGGDVLYERYVPQVDTTISIRKANIALDGERFHRWQNDERVAKFWEYPWSRDKLDAYLQARLDDNHCEPLIVSADDQPFAYVESYWCKEDRLGPYYQAHDYDQGFHLLVGEPQYQGKLTEHFLCAITHFLLLTDPRTEKVMGEPRADNKNLLKYVQQVGGWKLAGEVEFPHKTAALLRCNRHDFFSEVMF